MFKALDKFLSLAFGYIWTRYGEKHLSPEVLDSLVSYHSPTDGLERLATKGHEIGVAIYQGEVLELHLLEGSRVSPGRWVTNKISQSNLLHICEMVETAASLLSRNRISSDTRFAHEKQYSPVPPDTEPSNSSCLQIFPHTQPPSPVEIEGDSNGVSPNILKTQQLKVQQDRANPHLKYKTNRADSQHRCNRTSLRMFIRRI